VSPPRFGPRGWVYLLVLCSAVLFEGMSLSSVNVQVADVRADLALGPDRLQLVASAFLIAYAGLLLFGGAGADRWGARRVFLAGMTLFGLASAGAALAPGADPLIVARTAQGAGAALTAPAAVALLVHRFPTGPARNRALGVLSAMGALGFSLGVVLGGLVTNALGWRWAFALYVPLAVATLLLAHGLLEDTPRRPTPVPWAPAAGVTIGLIAVVYGIGAVGVASWPVAGSVFVAGLVVLAGSLLGQARSASPLVPRGLAADPRLRAASVGLGCGFAAIAGTLLLVGTGLQEQQGYSPLQTGLAFLPQGLAVGVVSLLAVRALDRWGPGRLLVTGLGVLVLGQLVYTTVLAGPYPTRLLPASLLVGTAIAAAYPAAAVLASSAAGAREQATASGVLITAQQAGAAVGVAAVTAAATLGSGYRPGLWTAVALAVVATLLAALILAGRPTTVREERDADVHRAGRH
jgi:MFS family permease